MKGKAAVLHGIRGDITVEEYTVPTPGPGEFVVKTELATVCGTDMHIYHGQLDFIPFPVILGHEFCGIIASLGEGIAEDTNGKPVKVGDRVVVAPGVACGQCYFCKIAKTPTRCTSCPTYGMTINDGNNVLTGGFGQYVHVKFPHTSFFKTDAPPEIAAITEPMSIAIHGYQRAGGVPIGGTVIVQGTGSVGLGAIAFAKVGGASQIIAVGGPKARLDLAKELGADVTVDIADIKDEEERRKYILSLTPGGRGADMVVEGAGFPAAIPQGLDLLRDSGTFVELGHFTDSGPVSINPHWQIVRKNCTILGVWGSSTEHLKVTLDIMEKHELPYEKMVSHQLPLSGLKESFSILSEKGYKMDNGQEVVKLAINPWL